MRDRRACDAIYRLPLVLTVYRRVPKTEVCEAGGFHLLAVNASPLYDVVYGGFNGLSFCITLLSRYARARFARREKKRISK